MDAMTKNRNVAAVLGMVLLFVAGCSSLVKVDATCDRMCLASPGPTLPAIPLGVPYDGGFPVDAPVDADADMDEDARPGWDAKEAGFPSVEIAWTAELLFNEVLDQLPSVASRVTAEVRVVAVELSSPVDLGFVESVEVTMSQGTGKRDGGAAQPVDAAAACAVSGVAMRLAFYQAPETTIARNAIPLTLVEPGLNVFDCMKKEKTLLHVRLVPRVGVYPAQDAPLLLKTCIGAALHTRLP